MVLSVVAGVTAAAILVMLVVTLVQLHGVRSSLDALARFVDKGASGRRAGDAASTAAAEALADVQARLSELAPIVARLDRGMRRLVTEGAGAPADRSVEDRSLASFGREGSDRSAALASRDEQGVRPATIPAPIFDPPVATGDEAEGGLEQLDRLLETYKDLISRPRRAEIAKWFDDVGGLGCEAADDGAFQMVGRGEGARLTLVQVTENFALVLPSASTVVDFATSFSDVLAARSAFRGTFRLDADGSGVLRLVEPAQAVRAAGTWRLKVPGALLGLVSA